MRHEVPYKQQWQRAERGACGNIGCELVILGRLEASEGVQEPLVRMRARGRGEGRVSGQGPGQG